MQAQRDMPRYAKRQTEVLHYLAFISGVSPSTPLTAESLGQIAPLHLLICISARSGTRAWGAKVPSRVATMKTHRLRARQHHGQQVSLHVCAAAGRGLNDEPMAELVSLPALSNTWTAAAVAAAAAAAVARLHVPIIDGRTRQLPASIRTTGSCRCIHNFSAAVVGS